jgi:copper oxidase (laccase) domain-containing protein
VTVRVRRVTTTREGGVSKPPFDTFNLCDHVGDEPEAVAANRKRLAAAMGLEEDRVIWMNQVHGDRVTRVDGPRVAAVEATDALVTTARRLALAVVTADCVPVLLADARSGVVAAVHAGRVGAQRGVVPRAVEGMQAAGANVEDMSVLQLRGARGDGGGGRRGAAGQQDHQPSRHPGVGPACRNCWPTQHFGCEGDRYRPQVHV